MEINENTKIVVKIIKNKATTSFPIIYEMEEITCDVIIHPPLDEQLEAGVINHDAVDIAECIASKDWKQRSSAYQALGEIIIGSSLPGDLSFEKIMTWLPSITGDSNPNALECALDLAISVYDNVPDSILNLSCQHVLSNIVDKAFSARPSIVTKGKRLILKLMEVGNDFDHYVSFLLAKWGDRRPKIPPLCIELIVDGMVLFGVAEFPMKDILREIPNVLNCANSFARDSCMKLMLEIHRWMGLSPIQSILDNIRSSQRADFEKLLSEIKDTNPAVPTLYTRKARQNVASGSAIAGITKIDVRSLVEEIDLVKKLKGSEFFELVVCDKWSEQLTALQIVQKLLGTAPNLKYNGVVRDIIGLCHGFLKQGHIQVQSLALKLLSVFAEALTDKINSDIRPLAFTLVSRSKEKKLHNDLQDALKKIAKYSTGYDVFASDCIDILLGKNPPNAKICIIELLEYAISEKLTQNQENLQGSVDAILFCCEESDAKVRESSFKNLRTLLRVSSREDKNSSTYARIIQGLATSHPKIYQKLNDSSTTKVSTTLTDSTTEVPAVTEGTTITKKGTSSVVVSDSVKVEKGNAISLRNSATSKPKSSNTLLTALKSVDNDDAEEDIMGLEQALEVVQALLPDQSLEALQSKFASAKWQDKSEALSELQACVQEGSHSNGQIIYAVLKFVAAQTNGFKINNLIVLKASIDLFCKFAHQSSPDRYCKSAAWELSRILFEKMPDKKLGRSVEELFSVFAKLCGANFMMKRLNQLVDTSKSPATLQSYLEWIKSIVTTSARGELSVSTLLVFVVKQIDHKQVGVRTLCVEVLGLLYNKYGPRLLTLFKMEELQPQVKVLLEAEFKRVGYDVSLIVEQKEDGDVFPRKDIFSMLDKNVLKDLNFVEGKNSWQTRKIALDSIIASCESSGFYLEYNKQTLELIRNVKLRLNDTQSNLKPLAMQALGKLIASLRQDGGQKALKLLGSAIFCGLADSKRPIREATISCVQLALSGNRDQVDRNLFMTILPFIPEAFGYTLGRQELLEWLAQRKDDFLGDCTDLVIPLFSALMDKLAPVRALAEQLLKDFLTSGRISKASVDRVVRDLAPANKRAIQSSLDRLAGISIATGTVSPDVICDNSSKSVVLLAEVSTSNNVSSNRNMMATMNALSENLKSEDMFLEVTEDKLWAEYSWPQPPQEPSFHNFTILKTHWSTYINRNAAEVLFPIINRFDILSQDTFLSALDFIQKHLIPSPLLNQHLRFLFPWLSYVLYVKEGAVGMIKLLETMQMCLVTMLKSHTITPYTEWQFIIPHLLEKIGLRNDSKHKIYIAAVYKALDEVIAPDIMAKFFLSGLETTNKRNKICCLKGVLRLIESVGAVALKRNGIHELVNRMRGEEKDSEALDLVVAIINAQAKALGTDLEGIEAQLEGLPANLQKHLAGVHCGSPIIPRDKDFGNVTQSLNVADCFASADVANLPFVLRTASPFLIADMRDRVMESLQLLPSMLGLLDTEKKSILVDDLSRHACDLSSARPLDTVLLALFIFDINALVVSFDTIPLSFELTVNIIKRCILTSARCNNGTAAIIGTLDTGNLVARGLHLILMNVCKGHCNFTLLTSLWRLSIEDKATSSEAKQVIARMTDWIVSSPVMDKEVAEERLKLLLDISKSIPENKIVSATSLHVLRKLISLVSAGMSDNQLNLWITNHAINNSVRSLLTKAVHIESSTSPIHKRIVAVIDQIASIPNKNEPINELYDIKTKHADINLEVYLSKLSPMFHSYVLEVWQKLDTEKSTFAKQTDSHSSLKERLPGPQDELGSHSVSEEATEAMRILEGLKARPIQFQNQGRKPSLNLAQNEQESIETSSPSRPRSTSRTSASPFARRNEKIRDSLSSLSASLDLPITLRENRANSAHSDLEERLQRLKSSMDF